MPGADRRAERHDGRGACVDQFARDDEIVVRVGQHDETFLHERFGGADKRFRIGKERLLVADHFELHPFRKSHFAAEARGANCFVGRVAAGGVWEDEKILAIDVVEQRFFRAVA